MEGISARLTKKQRGASDADQSAATSSTASIQFQRSFAHVDGNWPTFVYIPVTSSTSSVHRLLTTCVDHFLLDGRMREEQVCLETAPHISLSRTLTLRFHQIDAFISTLAHCLQTASKTSVEISSQCFFMSNDDKTRRFLCATVLDPAQALARLLAGVDTCVARFQKEVYYSPAVFHVSCASMVQDPTEHFPSDELIVPQLSISHDGVGKRTISARGQDTIADSNGDNDNESDEESEDDEPGSWRRFLPAPAKATQGKAGCSVPFSAVLAVECVECRIGNRLFRLSLPHSVADSDASRAEFREIFV